MDGPLLSALLQPTPLLASWFTWLNPSTARTRIAHDIAHFVNLYTANRNLNLRLIVVPHENLIHDPGVIEGGSGSEEAGPRAGSRGENRVGERERRAGTAPAVTPTTTTTTTTTMSNRPSPQEEARQYQQRELCRRREQETRSRREREEQRQKAEQEKRERIQRENAANRCVVRQQRGLRDLEEEDNAGRAWIRSRRVARMQREGQDPGVMAGGGVWGGVPQMRAAQWAGGT